MNTKRCGWTGVLLTVALAAGAGGCTHVKGIVINDVVDKPLGSAVLAVGRPGGISAVETHHVGKDGRFDFQVMATDENVVYVYDAGNPDATMRRVDRSELGENMRLHVRPATRDIGPEINEMPR